METAAQEVSEAIEQELAQGEEAYRYPPITLLEENRGGNYTEVGAELRNNSKRLADTLRSFGVDAKAGEVIHGPSVTRYEFTLDQGVKLSKITNLQDDIALALGASGVRIAPVPNKISAVGIEVPNRTVTAVRIRDVIESREFINHPSPVAFAVGKDIGGNNIVGNIARLPHVLIAGTTGSGKSVYQLADRQHALQVHAGRGAVHHGGSQNGGAGALQRHPAPADPGGHRPEKGRRCPAVGGVRDDEALQDVLRKRA